MKRQAAIIALVCALTASTAWAEESATSTRGEKFGQKRDEIRASFKEKKDEVKTQIQEKRAEIKTNIEERKGEKKIKLEERAKDRVTKILERVFGRFEAFVARYEGFATRIQSRIDKLDEKGVDTSEMKALLNTAEESLEDSVAEIAAAKDELDALVAGESSKEAIRAIVGEAKASLKETHAAFVAAVKSLKASDTDEGDDTEE